MSRSRTRVALVTGASRGIGAAIARLLGENGFAVVVNYLTMGDKAAEVVADIEGRSGRAMAICADVRDTASVAAMIRTAADAYGSIDVLVNNAISEVPLKPFAELSWDDFQALIEVQVRGAFNCCGAVLPPMERQGHGSIINILSTLALGVPPARNSAYVTAKSALLGFSKALAAEYTGRGVRVNMVSLSPTVTDLLRGLSPRMLEVMAAQHPMKRLGRPEDCAQAVLFLATEASAYVSGANLVVSGGQFMI